MRHVASCCVALLTGAVRHSTCRGRQWAGRQASGTADPHQQCSTAVFTMLVTPQAHTHARMQCTWHMHGGGQGAPALSVHRPMRRAVCTCLPGTEAGASEPRPGRRGHQRNHQPEAHPPWSAPVTPPHAQRGRSAGKRRRRGGGGGVSLNGAERGVAQQVRRSCMHVLAGLLGQRGGQAGTAAGWGAGTGWLGAQLPPARR